MSAGPVMDDAEVFASARHADMRIQVVMREISQGALAGMDSAITEHAARLIIAALDTFDYQALQTAWGDGFRQGEAFQKFRETPPARERPPGEIGRAHV